MIKKSGVMKFILLLLICSMILTSFVLSIPFSVKTDKDFLFVARIDGTIEIWNKSSGSLVKSFPNNIEEALSFETDGNNFYIGALGGKLHVFDLDTQKWNEINISSQTEGIYSLELSKDSRFLYIASSDGSILAMDTNTMSVTKKIEEHEYPPRVLVSDNMYLYSISSRAEMIKVWKTPDLVLEKELILSENDEDTKQKPFLWTAIIEKDKAYLGYTFGKMEIWDLVKGSLIKEVQAHSNHDIKGIVSDNEYIYSCGLDGNIKKWTFEGESVKPVLSVEGYTPLSLAVDDTYLYVGTREGGFLVYDKSNQKLVRKFGDFTLYDTYEKGIKEESSGGKKISPMLPILIVFAFFFVIVVIIEAYAHIKKKSGKITLSSVKEFFASFVKVEDILKMLGIASVIILVVGIINPRLAFPNFVSGLKISYYFDALIGKGGLLPIWFLLLPTLAYWIAKKAKKKVLERYLASLIGLLVAIVIYLLAPSLA